VPKRSLVELPKNLKAAGIIHDRVAKEARVTRTVVVNVLAGAHAVRGQRDRDDQAASRGGGPYRSLTASTGSRSQPIEPVPPSHQFPAVLSRAGGSDEMLSAICSRPCEVGNEHDWCSGRTQPRAPRPAHPVRTGARRRSGCRTRRTAAGILERRWARRIFKNRMGPLVFHHGGGRVVPPTATEQWLWAARRAARSIRHRWAQPMTEARDKPMPDQEHPVVVPQVMHSSADFPHVIHVSKYTVSRDLRTEGGCPRRTGGHGDTDKRRTANAVVPGMTGLVNGAGWRCGAFDQAMGHKDLRSARTAGLNATGPRTRAAMQVFAGV
jgi:hypothetical protein